MSVNPYRVRQLVRKEIAQLLRDVRTRMLIFVSPIIQLLMFGYAVNTDIPGTALYVVDHDRQDRPGGTPENAGYDQSLPDGAG